jgi:rhombotail lipoprotein
MKRHWYAIVVFVMGALAIAVGSGCAAFSGNAQRRSSSVMDYLYPRDTEHVDTPSLPTLSLPLRVGIAFVPEAQAKGHDSTPFSEEQKLALAKQISDDFRKYPFVGAIELIPSAYLTSKGSFANLDQVRSMFGVDVIALLSYDQVQFTDEGMLSMTYWTIVGAYVIRGEKNDTKTMMDAVVYDIPSRKLLFRVPGTSQIKGSATPINLTEQRRRDGGRGFEVAATNLVANLQEQLELFKERVKSSPEEYKVVHKPGYTGGAALGGLDLALLAVLTTGIVCSMRRKRADTRNC